MGGFAELGKGVVEYGLLGKGTGQKRPRGGCGSGALCPVRPGAEAVLGLEQVLLLINPAVAPEQLCNPWLRPQAEHRPTELSCPTGALAEALQRGFSLWKVVILLGVKGMRSREMPHL